MFQSCIKIPVLVKTCDFLYWFSLCNALLFLGICRQFFHWEFGTVQSRVFSELDVACAVLMTWLCLGDRWLRPRGGLDPYKMNPMNVQLDVRRTGERFKRIVDGQ